MIRTDISSESLFWQDKCSFSDVHGICMMFFPSVEMFFLLVVFLLCYCPDHINIIWGQSRAQIITLYAIKSLNNPFSQGIKVIYRHFRGETFLRLLTTINHRLLQSRSHLKTVLHNILIYDFTYWFHLISLPEV